MSNPPPNVVDFFVAPQSSISSAVEGPESRLGLCDSSEALELPHLKLDDSSLPFEYRPGLATWDAGAIQFAIYLNDRKHRHQIKLERYRED
ncbi:hypothetical protein RJ639_023940 [Escallonia herrerae]|uniref:Uncharacterized protein n=1 Tax=Escallonia herrerae TaxID=1293975 RepID=A0AA88V262_9ASTE|nr:hypothetical protein RJ639_023940 [Escallonia herrerae]